MAMAHSHTGEFASGGLSSHLLPNDSRVIILFDVDCFACQVWLNKNHPELRGHPVIVVSPAGKIVSVNYYARQWGIPKRHSGTDAVAEALELCPHLKVVFTGEKHGVMDTDTPQEESDKIIQVFVDYLNKMEHEDDMVFQMSSIDEFYVDVTNLVTLRMYDEFCKSLLTRRAFPSKNEIAEFTMTCKTFPDNIVPGNPMAIMEHKEKALYFKDLASRIRTVYGDRAGDYYDEDEARLICGAMIAQTLVNLVEQATGYELSAGVGYNKLTAKLACSRNKPQGITIFPNAANQRLMEEIEFQKLPNFGGVTGQKLCDEYERQTGKKLVTLADVQRIGDLGVEKLFVSIGQLRPGDAAKALLEKAALKDDEIVEWRFYAETVSQKMSFPRKGERAVTTWELFRDRIKDLSCLFEEKLLYRYNVQGRLPTQCVVKADFISNQAGSAYPTLDNKLDMSQLPSRDDIFAFVVRYVKANQLYFEDVTRITLTGSKFIEISSSE